VNVVAPPAVTSITSGLLCQGAMSSFVVDGTNFIGAAVLIDGQVAPSFTCATSECTVFTGSLLPGTHQLAIRSFLQAASDSAPVTFVLEAGPSAPAQPQPATVLAGAGRTLFVPLSRKTGLARTAQLQLAADSATSFSPQVQDAAGGALVTIPVEAPAGDYRLTIEDDSPCAPIQAVAVRLAGSATVESFAFDTDNQGANFGPLGSSGDVVTVINDWIANLGNPGGAVIGSVAAGADAEYFEVPAFTISDEDVGVARFDLQMQSCPAADRIFPAAVRLTGFALDTGLSFTMTRPLDPPACGSYTHYDVPFDSSWTYVDAHTAARPATARDFNGRLGSLFVPGNFSPDGDVVVLDNVVVDLSQ
jgi:hypothetical protein